MGFSSTSFDPALIATNSNAASSAMAEANAASAAAATKDNYASWSFAVDGITKDAITSGDVLDFVGGDNITITRSAEDQITISGSAGGGGLFDSYAIIADVKAQNTDGGTFTQDAWRRRDLNTEITDVDGIVSISSNQFTLGAGNYLIKWSCPAKSVSFNQSSASLKGLRHF